MLTLRTSGYRRFRRVSGQVGLPKFTNTYHLNRKQNGNIVLAALAIPSPVLVTQLIPKEDGNWMSGGRKERRGRNSRKCLRKRRRSI